MVHPGSQDQEYVGKGIISSLFPIGPHFKVGTPRLVGTTCNRGHVERNKVHLMRDTKCEEERKQEDEALRIRRESCAMHE
jgi:hypothetical protein